MKHLLLVALCSLIVVTAQEDKLQQIQQITKGSQFGENLHSLIALQLQGDSPIEEIAKLVQALIKQLEQDLSDLELSYAQSSGQEKLNMEKLENTLEQLVGEQKIANAAVHDLSQELASMIEQYNHLKKQLNLLNGKEEEVRDEFAQNALAYDKRQGQAANTVRTLEDITDKLAQAIFASRDKKDAVLTEVEKRQVMDQLIDKYGAENPIVMLAQVSSSFEESTVIYVIEKLEYLRDDIVKSIESDTEAAIQGRINFDAVMMQIHDSRKGLAADYQSLESNIRKKANERVLAERTRDQLNEDVPVLQEALTTVRTQSDINQSVYHEQHNDLEKQLTVVKRAFSILTQ